MLDHLRIIVRRQKRLMLAAGWHRDVTDKVGQPGKLRLLQFGVLMPVMVDVPGLVRDHEVIGALLDGVLEDHEILDQHLIHAADRLKAVQFMLAAFELDMPRFAGKPRA